MGFFSRIGNALARSLVSTLKPSEPSVPTLTTPKLYVAGLSRLTTCEKLQEAFAPFGNLVEVKIITDGKSGISKGFGFVTYETIKEAKNAIQLMNAKCLDNFVIYVEPAKPRTPRPPPRREPQPSEIDFKQQEPQPSESGFKQQEP